jgi:hypothetical protein
VNNVIRLGIAASLMTALAGCASVTPIGDLLNNAARYDGKSVRVEGEVREAAGGLGMGAYQVRDKTGTIPVVTSTSPPRTGSQIGVKGIFQSVFTIGTRSLAVLKEESRSTP